MLLRRRSVQVIGLALVSVLASVTSCGGASSPASGSDKTLRIFAAASLGDAMTELSDAFISDTRSPDNSELQIELNVAGSATLREQILAGAPGDVFVSANQKIMDDVAEYVATENGVEDVGDILAANSMAIITPPDNTAGVSGLSDLGRDEILVGLCNEGVPCGDFAAEILDRAAVDPQVDTFEDNVRSLLTRVSVGELDAAVVYRSDVVSAGPSVASITIPDDLNIQTLSTIAVLDTSLEPALAELFVEFALSPAGQQILQGHGLEMPAS